MSGHWQRAAVRVALGASGLLLAGVLAAPGLGADRPVAPDVLGWTPLPQAVRTMQQSGRPTVVVVTSRSDPGSKHLCQTLADVLRTQTLGAVVQLSEMPVELYTERVRALGVTRFPTVLAYRRRGQAIDLAGFKVGVVDAYVITGWLSGLDLTDASVPPPERASSLARTNPPMPARPAPSPAPANDPGLSRAGFEPTDAGATRGDRVENSEESADPDVSRTQYGMASPQHPSYQSPPSYPPPQAPAPPPMAYQAPPQQVAVPYAAPAPSVVMAPAPTPTVLAQQPQTIIMAPAPQPNIVFASPAPSQPNVVMAPTVSMAPAAASAPSQPAQLFLSAPAAAPAPVAAAPAYAPVAAAPVAAAPVAAVPVAAAPVAYAPQQVAQGPVTTAVATMILTNPSLLGRIVGTIGEHLAEKKQPRVRMAEAPVTTALAPAPVASAPQQAYLAAPAAAAPAMPAGYAVPAAAYGAPAGYPPSGPGYPPSGPGYPPYPPTPGPSPQH